MYLGAAAGLEVFATSDGLDFKPVAAGVGSFRVRGMLALLSGTFSEPSIQE